MHGADRAALEGEAEVRALVVESVQLALLSSNHNLERRQKSTTTQLLLLFHDMQPAKT